MVQLESVVFCDMSDNNCKVVGRGICVERSMLLSYCPRTNCQGFLEPPSQHLQLQVHGLKCQKCGHVVDHDTEHPEYRMAKPIQSEVMMLH